ncbi:unnamed protein product [Anisakis simplex]|uniref:Glutamate dehydrogenase, mitochondrial (inferred by orthology to a D. melanogaster protein) n=1 Tax=Anisakis simplex TaxID=6269 RepID=A0A0M3JI05_ANISI|nr:unnamed protein product [Anisakis simplex]
MSCPSSRKNRLEACGPTGRLKKCFQRNFWEFHFIFPCSRELINSEGKMNAEEKLADSKKPMDEQSDPSFFEARAKVIEPKLVDEMVSRSMTQEDKQKLVHGILQAIKPVNKVSAFSRKFPFPENIPRNLPFLPIFLHFL